MVLIRLPSLFNGPSWHLRHLHDMLTALATQSFPFIPKHCVLASAFSQALHFCMPHTRSVWEKTENAPSVSFYRFGLNGGLDSVAPQKACFVFRSRPHVWPQCKSGPTLERIFWTVPNEHDSFFSIFPTYSFYFASILGGVWFQSINNTGIAFCEKLKVPWRFGGFFLSKLTPLMTS